MRAFPYEVCVVCLRCYNEVLSVMWWLWLGWCVVPWSDPFIVTVRSIFPFPVHLVWIWPCLECCYICSGSLCQHGQHLCCMTDLITCSFALLYIHFIPTSLTYAGLLPTHTSSLMYDDISSICDRVRRHYTVSAVWLNFTDMFISSPSCLQTCMSTSASLFTYTHECQPNNLA